MLFRWLGVGTAGLLALVLVTAKSKDTPFLLICRNLTAIALVGNAATQLRRMEKEYEDIERKEDMLFTLKEVQGEEQLQFLETSAESRRSNEQADKDMERQLRMLQETAPLFSELLSVTGRNGAVERMALGMLQGGASLGDVLVATADAEIKLEQAKLAAQLQQRQMEMQAVAVATSNQLHQDVPIQAPLPTSNEQSTPQALNKASVLKQAAAIVGIKTECIHVDKAPSYERLVFGIKTSDYNLLNKWKQAAKLALGEKYDLPMYVHGSEKVAIETSFSPHERTFYDFPIRQWLQGDATGNPSGERLMILGQSLDGEVIVDLASEDTPQVLVVGTTGSGKSNFLRSAAYCLLMQGAKVDICGGKVSDYEDFPPKFPSISINDMDKAFEYVGEYYQECDRRNSMSKEELAQQPAWVLLIDEYKGTVPLDELRKTYDQQLCEVARRGRGLKIHVIIGLQRGSKRSATDPQGLPPDLRDNLPCRIAFRCTDAVGGRMVLHHRGEVVTSLQGRGDGIVQSGLLDTRFQAYRFETIP
ncbi:MAG: hypothetical protein KME21_30700 [Desmonostoc vinosum HA7617-LM4]|jgi:hypothetical protein|nr:hypothetical protein [Desmonostoc vinosum HA7617-LM4]